ADGDPARPDAAEKRDSEEEFGGGGGPGGKRNGGCWHEGIELGRALHELGEVPVAGPFGIEAEARRDAREESCAEGDAGVENSEPLPVQRAGLGGGLGEGRRDGHVELLVDVSCRIPS